MLDAVIVSDIHLGSPASQPRRVLDFLRPIEAGEVAVQRLLINGDLFDTIDARLDRHEWKVLSLLSRLARQIEVVWIRGNHDLPEPEIVAGLAGIRLVDEFCFQSGDQTILCIHGDRWDDFIRNYPVTTWVADVIYQLLQKLDRTHTLARAAKTNSKTFVRTTDKVRHLAIEHAKKMGASIICCGHTHQPLSSQSGGVAYFNSGCWTDRPCNYLTVENGFVRIEKWV